MSFRAAIIGMACRFPKAANASAFWDNITRGVDATSDYPMATRWGKHDGYYRSGVEASLDQVYCRRGGVVADLSFNPLDYGVVPREVEEADADQFVMLDLAREALRDAGIERSGRETTALDAGVIIGRTMPIGPVVLRYLDRIKLLPQLVEELRAGALPEESIREFTERFLSQRRAGFEHSRTRNLVAGFTASRISNRLNLCGPNYILDAACASSLVAIENAMFLLAQGKCELMLAGGVHLPLTQGYWSMFTNIGALSRRERIRPFDRDADGLLLGEGAGLIVLKPLDAALAAGDRIYAVIDGVGSSSDGREESMLAPSSQGQCRAFQRAWLSADRGMEQAAYIECHGTGMPRGDEVEAASLCASFGRDRPRPVALGSIKSMIGHTLGAAGIASVMKTALALEHDVIPPSLHCTSLRGDLAEAGFHVPDKLMAWPDDAERVAGVSAFGFGGVNAHVVLSAAPERRSRRAVRSARARLTSGEPALVLAAADAAQLLQALDTGAKATGGPARLVVFEPTPERMRLARRVIGGGKRWSGRDGIYYSPAGVFTRGGKLAFLFPGLGDQVSPQIPQLARALDLDFGEQTLADDALASASLESAHSSYTLAHALMKLGVQPDAFAGHSLGEWMSCVSAGVIEPDDLRRLVAQFGLTQVDFMASGYHLLAVWRGVERLQPLVEGIEGLAIAVDNCPGHSVICGTAPALTELRRRLQAQAILFLDLGVEAASHTDFIRPSLEAIRPVVERLALTKPVIPLWSSSLASPFPDDVEAMRQTIFETMARPVRFRELIENMYRDGFQAFVQLGNAGLSGFAGDTLRGLDVVTLDAGRAGTCPEAMLRRVAAGLYVEGLELDVDRFGVATERSAPAPAVSAGMSVPLEPSLVEIYGLPSRPREGTQPAKVDEARLPAGAIEQLLRSSSAAFERAQKSVVAAASRRPRVMELALAPHASSTEAAMQEVAAKDRAGDLVHSELLSIDHDRYPELFDHEVYRSDEGAPIADRSAVVPMAMMIELAMDVMLRYRPSATIAAVSKVISFRFIDVKGPVTLPVRVTRREDGGYTLVVGEHFSCAVELAEAAGSPPLLDPAAWQVASGVQIPHPIPFDEIYRERWLFHGPRYQGLRSVDRLDATGAIGTVSHAGGRGSLLDSAFQLAGMWFHSFHVVDSVVMPLKIERLRFFAPAPVLQDRAPFDCRVFVDAITDNEFVYSLELARHGRVLMRVERFAGRRFETDHKLGAIFRTPERATRICEVLDERVFVFEYGYRTNWIRVMLRNTYLSSDEVAALDGIKAIQRQNASLMGLIAAKEALKHWFSQNGATGSLHPKQMRIGHDERGAPFGFAKWDTTARNISISHKPGIGVAIVGANARVGVDVEMVEPRSEAFEQLNFDADETAFLDRHAATLRPYLVTLLWTVKEAYAKYTGQGLAGSALGIKVRNIVIGPDGGQGQVEGMAFTSRRHKDHAVISWVIESVGETQGE